MSVPSSFFLKKIGFKKGMMVGFWTMAAGAFIFVPSAYTRTYEMFLLGLFTIGTGLSILQTAANPYITVLGSKERAAQRISIMGICNKGAGILAPLIFAAVILKATDTHLFKEFATLDEAAKSIVLPEQYFPKKNLNHIYMQHFEIFEKLSVKLKDDFENVVKLQ